MAEHMTVCGGHLEADDTPNQIYRYIYIHQTKYTGMHTDTDAWRMPHVLKNHKFRQTNPLKFVLL